MLSGSDLETTTGGGIHEEKNGQFIATVGHIDKVENETSLTPSEQKRLIRKIDVRLVGTCGLLLCISLMDRTNLSAAAIAGLVADLQLSIGNRYSIVALVFFTTYIVFQFPATAVLRYVGPRMFLAGVTLGWGATILGMGFAKDWTVILWLRFVLGIFEAGSYPGSIYLISTWYTRYELQKRYSILYAIGTVAGGSSGILGYGLMQMKDLGGLDGWSWIFIMEGIISCLVAVASYWLLMDFPDKALNSWHPISMVERDFMIARVHADRADENLEPFSYKKFFESALDLKIWGFALLNFGTATISYAVAYFLPLILNNGLGFTVAQAQCLVAPPYGVGAVLMFGTAWIGDKYHIRGPLIIINSILMFIGLCLVGLLTTPAVRYFGVFFIIGGGVANIPALLAYQANNITGQWKRAFCSASLVSFGGLGGIAGSLMFRSQDAPNYRPGVYGCMACCALIIITVIMLTINFIRLNHAQAKGRIVEGIQGFRYTI